MLVYILIQVEIENDARITFQNASHVAPPARGWEAAGATSSRSSPRPLSPSSPATAGACQRPEGFALQPGRCCRALTKCQGWFGGEHREGLAIARLFMKACFLGGASYRFCCHLPRRCTEKNNGKIVNYGKQHFTAFIIFRIIGINLLMGTVPWERGCWWKWCPVPWGTGVGVWNKTSHSNPPA